MSGALVAQIPGEAAILAFSRGGKGTTPKLRDYELATMQLIFGKLRESAVVPQAERELAALHESGHSTVAHASPHHRLLVATTIPIGDSGGSTWASMEDIHIPTYDSFVWDLAVSMAGREAEKLKGRPTAGGGHDIQRMTEIALDAICRWGLFDGFTSSIDVKRWMDHPRAAEIDAKVQELLDAASEKAREVLTSDEYRGFRSQLEQELLARRILHSDELAALAAETVAV